jgi:hypothetical protein
MFQGNLNPFGGKHPQVNSFVPPNLGQSYPGYLNPTWGPKVPPSVPFQENPPNQSNPMGYVPKNPPQPNLSKMSPYL